MEQFVRVDMAVIIILSGMNRSANPHSKSETGFILINGQSKYEQRTRWQWLTQRSHFPLDLPHHQRLSYAEKKRVLSGLQTKLRTSSNFKIREGFSLKQNARIASTPSSATLLSQKRYQPYVYLNPREEQADIPALKFGVDQSDLLKRMTEADQRGNRILALVSVRRVGLRYRLNHSFVEKCGKCMPNHRHDLKDISGQAGFLVKQFGNHIKELYYYSPKGIPINTYQDILQENALIADIHPKLSFSQEITWRVFDLVGKISQIIATLYRKLVSERKHSESGDQSGSNQQQAEEIYDHQRIKDVELYVDRLSQDPQFKLPQPAQIRNELSRWYDQKYQPEQNSIKEGDKNLLFESKCHYPQQIINRKMLKLANQKVEQLPSTCNKHKFIPQKIDLMMEHIRREQTVNAKASVIPFQPITKRDMLARLDRKNSLLSTQNIPYLIEKYGLNRYEIYNLYNLYKAFEKIAIMRNPNLQTTESVAEKGIDRQTFEAGLKGLDMNPGEELIKNICHFGDFISWQQFIKIISISLRKTPQEKLSAILKGISSFDDGYLSKHQISLMVGNSLHKLFDHQEAELKDYFTNMAMSEFDPNNTGRVEVELLKTKVLNRGSENLNMVSFLILNT